MSKIRNEPPELKGPSPLSCVLIALFLYVAAVVLFLYLAYEEQHGGGFSGHAAVVLLYKLGGKWLVAGVSAVMATGFLTAGILGMKKPRE